MQGLPHLLEWLQGLVRLGSAERASLAGLTPADVHVLQQLTPANHQAEGGPGFRVTQQAADCASAILSYAAGDLVDA